MGHPGRHRQPFASRRPKPASAPALAVDLADEPEGCQSAQLPVVGVTPLDGAANRSRSAGHLPLRPGEERHFRPLLEQAEELLEVLEKYAPDGKPKPLWVTEICWFTQLERTTFVTSRETRTSHLNSGHPVEL